MFINYKREIYALAHLNLSTASFKFFRRRVSPDIVLKLVGPPASSGHSQHKVT